MGTYIAWHINANKQLLNKWLKISKLPITGMLEAMGFKKQLKKTNGGIGAWWCVYTEKAMAPYSSTLARKIQWAEEPARLQSMGSLRVGHNWSISLSCIGEGNGNPLQYSCLENPRDEGAWWAAVYGFAQSQTRLKRLSSSSSSSSSSITFRNHMALLG